MSAAELETVSTTNSLNDMPRLRGRRRQACKRRVDIGLALLIALTALMLVPGVAIVAVAALMILAVCGISIPIERWRSRRG